MQVIQTNNRDSQVNKLVSLMKENDLWFIPLHSINQGETHTCTCNNPECSSPGKHPYIKYNWKVVASTDIQKLLGYYQANPNINFGIVTGRKSRKTYKYLVVVDVDEPSHPILKTLTPTLSYKTGSGGYHFWYWSDINVKSSVGTVAKKVDIRGHGAYVVVPPSIHETNFFYTFDFSKTKVIADLPDRFKNTNTYITSTSHSTPLQSNKPRNKHNNTNNSSWWNLVPISDLRNTTTKIPLGVRNSTIHRLLSSDRACGANKEELQNNANIYRNWCEEPITLTQSELNKIIRNVLRYKPRNTLHEKVNENFFLWKQKHKQKLSSAEKELFINLDNLFFQQLKKTNNFSKGISLTSVANKREFFLQKNNLNSYSVYRPQLLAKKLQDLGFEKCRTNKGNLWNIDLQDQEDMI